MLIHFGERIEDRLNEIGLSKAEFDRRIGLSRQGVHALLQRESPGVMLLHRIGVVLDHDFLELLPQTGPIKSDPKRHFVLVEVGKTDLPDSFYEKPGTK